MTLPGRPLRLRHHLCSAAASCEGRAIFHTSDHHPRDAAIWNALADLFYEAAEQDDHDTPIGHRLVALANLLNDLGDDEPSDVTDITPAGRAVVNGYVAHRTKQHPRGGEPT